MYIYTYVHAFIYIYMYIYIYICIYIYAHVYIYIYVFIYMCPYWLYIWDVSKWGALFWVKKVYITDEKGHLILSHTHVCIYISTYKFLGKHINVYRCMDVYMCYSSPRQIPSPLRLCVPRLGHVGGGWPTTNLGHRSDRWGGATVQPLDCLIWASFATSPSIPRTMRRIGLLRLQLANLGRSNSLGSENSSNRASALIENN